MSKLIRGFELELAAAIGQVLEITDSLLLVAIELLSRRCERFGRWSVDTYLGHLICLFRQLTLLFLRAS